ncbi:T9SS type A sorting domain-containing protein, partial [candidate division WOR-3 bacterium]|nr:T9SS type A sorting domain-containing protein [candidate division WOR-3 bacterium]
NILLSVYPTPAVENIWVDYTLPKRGDVSLKIYNIQGQEVTSLYNGTRDAGNYSTVWERTDVTNGIYFLHLSTDYGEITRRILVLK